MKLKSELLTPRGFREKGASTRISPRRLTLSEHGSRLGSSGIIIGGDSGTSQSGPFPARPVKIRQVPPQDEQAPRPAGISPLGEPGNDL